MSTKVLYETAATAEGGRDGRSTSEDGRLDVKLSTPKELWGNGGEGTNPEQLFAAGYSACFLNAMKYIADQQKLEFPMGTRVTATIGIGPRDDADGFGLAISLNVKMPGVDAAEALSLAEAAHKVCPYSNAVRNNVDVKIDIV